METRLKSSDSPLINVLKLFHLEMSSFGLSAKFPNTWALEKDGTVRTLRYSMEMVRVHCCSTERLGYTILSLNSQYI